MKQAYAMPGLCTVHLWNQIPMIYHFVHNQFVSSTAINTEQCILLFSLKYMIFIYLMINICSLIIIQANKIAVIFFYCSCNTCNVSVLCHSTFCCTKLFVLNLIEFEWQRIWAIKHWISIIFNFNPKTWHFWHFCSHISLLNVSLIHFLQ